MNHASLFSGIGGAEVAACMMGWQNLGDYMLSFVNYIFQVKKHL